MKKWLKWVLIIVGVIICIVVVLFAVSKQYKNVSEDNLPKFIKANVVDPKLVMSVSKFRSTAGHSNAGWPETCRSMKHYVNTIDPNKKVVRLTMDLRKQRPSAESAIDIFSPVDGMLQKGGTGEGDDQVNISVDGYPGFSIRLEHVHLNPGLRSFVQPIKAGEKIATISDGQNFDLSVYYHYYKGDELFSYFQVLPDDLFAAWQAQGATSRGEFIITKEYRDAHPGMCDKRDPLTPNFVDAKGKVTENWTDENFVKLAASKYQEQLNPQKQELNEISSFEECAKHYPVIDTSPPTCKTETGKFFTKGQ